MVPDAPKGPDVPAEGQADSLGRAIRDDLSAVFTWYRIEVPRTLRRMSASIWIVAAIGLAALLAERGGGRVLANCFGHGSEQAAFVLEKP